MVIMLSIDMLGQSLYVMVVYDVEGFAVVSERKDELAGDVDDELEVGFGTVWAYWLWA